MILGIYWPLDNVTFLPQFIINILPLSVPYEAVTAVLIKGHYLQTDDIYYAILSIICWTLIPFIGLFFTLKNKITFLI